MPSASGKKKRSLAQKLALNKVRANTQRNSAGFLLGMTELASESPSASSLAEELALAQKKLHVGEDALEIAELEQEMQCMTLEATQSQLVATTNAVAAAHSKNDKLYKDLPITKHTLQRAVASKIKLQEKVKLLQTVDIPQAQKHAAVALKLLDKSAQEHAQVEENLSDTIDNFLEQLHAMKAELEKSQRRVHALEMQCHRTPAILARKIENAEDKV
jgi:hypothetical protein